MTYQDPKLNQRKPTHQHILKLFLNKLVPKETPLPAKVLKFTCLAIIIASLGGISANITLGFPMQINLIIGFCTLAVVWLFFKMPLYSHYNRSGLILILLELLTVSLNWFASGGLYSSAPYFIMILIGFAAVILTDSYLWVTVTMCILTMLILIGLESLFPQWIPQQHNPFSWQVKSDIIFAFIMLSYPLSWFISFMSRVNRQQYERAEEASRAKSLFLSQLSHELRTPLNAVIGFSKVMLGKEMPFERQQDFTKRIHTNGFHLLALVNQIMDLSMIETGKLDIVWQDVNLLKILKEIEDVISVQAQEKGLTYHTELPAELSPQEELKVHTDPNRIRQILINLISNGLKFSEQGGVSSKVEILPEWVQVQIEDTGTGIPQDKQKHIFEPFVRLEKHKDTEGTGMGLTITQLLCKHLKCELKLVSSSEQGSVFSVSIPRTQQALGQLQTNT